MITVQSFLILLTAFSVTTSLVTEALKKVFDDAKMKYSCNILALVVSVLVSIIGMIIYFVNADIDVNAVNTTYVFMMVVANWLCATLGYDKVIQTIKQIIGE